LINYLAVAQKSERLLVETEVPQGAQRSPDAADDPITASLRQAA
jgi:hypothetical protein